MNQLRVATVNLGARPGSTSTGSQQLARARQVCGTDPDVVCLQDAGKLSKAPTSEYRLIRPPGPGETCPLLVRRDRAVTGLGGQLVLRPGPWPAKWISWVEVEGVPVLNHHIPAHIDRRGHPRPGEDARVAGALAYLDELARAARHLGATVIAGDTNVDSEADERVRFKGFPSERLGRLEFTDAIRVAGPDAHRGTLGKRNVDRVFVAPGWRVTDYRVLSARDPFNHRPVVVDLERV